MAFRRVRKPGGHAREAAPRWASRSLKSSSSSRGSSSPAFVLNDVFASILIPGPNKTPFAVAIVVRNVSLPVWRHVSRSRAGGRRQRLANIFAPLLFLLSFGTWIVLLMLGFGLMFHASARAFNPPLGSLDQAIYVAGSSLLTLGVSEVDATGHARWLILWAALSGFGVITAAFTYILQVQNSLHQRESGVLTLSGLAGKPPSGVTLLESYAHLRLKSESSRVSSANGATGRPRRSTATSPSRSWPISTPSMPRATGSRRSARCSMQPRS